MHNVTTVGRTFGSDIVADLTKYFFLGKRDFDLVIHAGGKAHSTPKNKQERHFFFDVNLEGTRNLLRSLEATSLPSKFIFISSVAVYGAISGLLINENASLLAKDPYGLSKILAEQLVQEWCARNNVICTILRLPLIAGPNPPGNLGAMIKGIKDGYYFNIAGGHERRSMVLTEDVAKYILVASQVGGVYHLTDGYHPSYFELSACISKQLNKSSILNLTLPIAKLLAIAGDIIGPKSPINSDKLRKITSTLTFDDSKASIAFGWNPTPVLEGFKIC